MVDLAAVYRRRLIRRVAGLLLLGITLPVFAGRIARQVAMPLTDRLNQEQPVPEGTEKGMIMRSRVYTRDPWLEAARWVQGAGGTALGLVLMGPIGPWTPRARRP